MLKLLLITSLIFVFCMCTDKTATGPNEILSSQSSVSTDSLAIESATTGTTSVQTDGINPPELKNLYISGSPRVDSVLSVNYWYYDANEDVEGESHVQWLRNGVPIEGANSLNYTLTKSDSGKQISINLTPVSLNEKNNIGLMQSDSIDLYYFIDKRDGKSYNYTTIGDQVWMAENLNYNIDNNHSICPGLQEENCNIHGRMYDIPTAFGISLVDGIMPKVEIERSVTGICPSGWLVPGVDDWRKMFIYILMKENLPNESMSGEGNGLRWDGLVDLLGPSSKYGFNGYNLDWISHLVMYPANPEWLAASLSFRSTNELYLPANEFRINTIRMFYYGAKEFIYPGVTESLNRGTNILPSSIGAHITGSLFSLKYLIRCVQKSQMSKSSPS